MRHDLAPAAAAHPIHPRYRQCPRQFVTPVCRHRTPHLRKAAPARHSFRYRRGQTLIPGASLQWLTEQLPGLDEEQVSHLVAQAETCSTRPITERQRRFAAALRGALALLALAGAAAGLLAAFLVALLPAFAAAGLTTALTLALAGLVACLDTVLPALSLRPMLLRGQPRCLRHDEIDAIRFKIRLHQAHAHPVTQAER